jgi:hypothetical protein
MTDDADRGLARLVLDWDAYCGRPADDINILARAIVEWAEATHAMRVWSAMRTPGEISPDRLLDPVPRRYDAAQARLLSLAAREPRP